MASAVVDYSVPVPPDLTNDLREQHSFTGTYLPAY
jgi:hypothetical protein